MKWKYRIEWAGSPMLGKELDALGDQGWELCGVIEYARSYYYYFKKLIND